MSEFAIETTNLTKRFGDVVAVDNLNLKIPYREVFGLLGPNGAGKTTTLNMLCTVLKQSSGKALVDGHDIDKEPAAVRKSIGIVFQDPSIDDRLTGRENLEMMRTYSGGMRRRLELARGLLHYPKILFLDEPTIGLDPQTREHIWEYIKELIHRKKITVVLTTHYMEEADELCDRVGIIDYGRIVALDTPENLKHKIGGDVITAEVSRPEELALELKKHDSTLTLGFTEKIIRVTVPEGEKYISRIIHAADTLNMNVDSVTVKKPTLNDVFLSYTGHEIRDETGKTMGTMLSIRRRRIK